MTDHLTAAEAARLLGVTTTTIRSYAARGKLTPIELLPGRNGYPRAEVEALVENPPRAGRPRNAARWFAVAQRRDEEGRVTHRFLTHRDDDETKPELRARAEAMLQPGERVLVSARSTAPPHLLRLADSTPPGDGA